MASNGTVAQWLERRKDMDNVIKNLDQRHLDFAINYILLYECDVPTLLSHAETPYECIPTGFTREDMGKIMSFIKYWATNVLK